MASAEGPLPERTGIHRFIDLRFAREDGALVVRPQLLGYLIAAIGMVIGIGIAANGVWGRTGDGGQIAFGTAYSLIGVWFAFITSRTWVVADAAGLRVGVVRQRRVPWDQLTAVTMEDATRWFAGMSLGIERRSARTLVVLAPFMIRRYHTVSELREVARLLAMEAERRGHPPIPWPEHVRYRTRGGEVRSVG